MKSALAVAIALTVVALWPAVASAHAVLLRATPSSAQSLAQAPSQVQLLFSEPIDPIFSRVQVQEANGEHVRVDLDDSHVSADDDRLLEVSIQPGLPNGIYTVVWRSLSAVDVHPDEGQYPLFVGVPVSSQAQATTLSNTASPETTLGRWWFYVAASLFGGVLATWKLVLGPVLEATSAPSRGSVQRRAFRLIVAGGVLLLLGTLFSAVAQAASAANVPLSQGFGQPLADLLLRGRFAAVWWPRLGLEIASLALIAFGGIDGLASECALATLPAVLLTSALTSHGASLPGLTAAGITIDWLHIVGATVWVGGLIALASVFGVLRTEVTTPAPGPQVMARFARLALVGSLAVLVSGVTQGALEVGSWSAAVGTAYGQLLLLKSGLLTIMLGLAGVNEWRRRAPGRAGLQVGVGAELALGVVVFGVAAVLSGTPPTPNV